MIRSEMNFLDLGEGHGFHGVGVRLLTICIILFMTACQSDNSKSEIRSSTTEIPLPPSGDDYFLDITKASGIDFTHSLGDEHLSNLIETVGSGAAWLDYDQDGYMDLYLSNCSYHPELSTGERPSVPLTNRLYRNEGNGRFKDVTLSAGVNETGYGMGLTIGDFDNNGYPDIYVCNYGPNVLYRNNGDGTFSDVTSRAGIAGESSSVGATWFDMDNDGLLDLYVANYIRFDPQYNLHYAPDGFAGPMAYDGQADRLYKNEGDGTFRDVTEEMGVFNSQGRAMGVGSADYDNDGYMDVFVANDHMLNYMYHNEQGKGFKEVGIATGVAFNQVGEATISMSVDFADFDQDGWMDLFVSDDGFCSLYKNEGNGVFSETSYKSGIASASGQFVGWAASFIDYDNDADPDLFKVNGELKHLYGQEDQLFENVGGGKFVDVSVEKGDYFKQESVGRGGAFSDYDNDGDLDAYVSNLNEAGTFLRNDKGNSGNWIEILLIGTRSNRDGVGAQVRVTTGTRTLANQKKSSSGYLSQNDPRLHFGLGDREVIDSIEIIWPSGTIQTLENIDANQIISITESESL